MEASAQVIFLLQVIINLAPIAVYFLVLGLVNSQAHPWMVNARSDFSVLTLVFVPVMVWPIPFLVSNGLWWVVLAGMGFGAAGMIWLMPGRNSGWVVYNIAESHCRRVFEQAAGSLGWDCRWEGNQVRLPVQGLVVRFSVLPMLRNVTLHLEGVSGKAGEQAADRLRERLELQLSRQALLPSLSGSCMVLVGVVLMMFPLWMMSRHMDAIVELVTRLLS